ncbi:MAG: tRNA 2-thiouridine(34) synthase MnmA [Dehalococcoidia bacterium]|nr:tRNA 2-thiouridine(34) synthase MnmA [Dehalococcoidia bacterium]
MKNFKKTVVVAMSGGVDSSVAALLLHNEGYNVIGVTMRLFPQSEETNYSLNKSCCSLDDVEDARSVCRQINAKHYYLNFEKEFNEHVINYFISEYQKGRTPFPCLACNDRLKFDFLLKRAEFMKADYIATGHYASIIENNNEYKLIKGVDETKDQSYVLFNLTQSIMNKLKLPVGIFPKNEIRKIAEDHNLINAKKPDSQDICFIPDGDYKKFINNKIDQNEGIIVDSKGNKLGDHSGIHNFTIGQRKGIGIETKGKPIFVTKIYPSKNIVEVGPSNELMQRKAFISKVNIISKEDKITNKEIFAKIRYKSTPAKGRLTLKNDGNAVFIFDEPQRAITPGQALVFYNDNEVIGGGFIEYEDSTLLKEKNKETVKSY